MFVETAGSAHRAGATNGELNDTDTNSTGVVFFVLRVLICAFIFNNFIYFVLYIYVCTCSVMLNHLFNMFPGVM